MMQHKTPNYLVKTKDGVLHSYYTLGILLLDVLSNETDVAEVYEARRERYQALRYEVVSVETLRTKNNEEHLKG